MSGEIFRAYLERLELLGHGFHYTELVDGTRRKGIPPVHQWQGFARTLALWNLFRERHAAPITPVAAFRPSGGAANSQHKYGRAIDGDSRGPEYFETAVRVWCEFGKVLKVGLGLYTWSRWNKSGIRVHLDTGYACRSWQGVSLGPSFQRPYKILGQDGKVHALGLPVKLAVDLGLDVPSLDYL